MSHMTDYIIVQAGGKGSRLKQLTVNKPKAIVPISNLPMLFHLFRKFPDSRFIVIADYKAEVLEKYLAAFASVKYRLVNAAGNKGTCAGIRQALRFIPESQPFMLVWSDLILGENFQAPEEAGNYVGLSTTFSCRWKFENGKFAEKRSEKYGVAGVFFFHDKEVLVNVSQSGEFVRWLSGQEIECSAYALKDVEEFGELTTVKTRTEEKCRPFNKIEEINGHIVKTAIDDQGKSLAFREKAWYQTVIAKGYKKIPRIYSYDPFEMEKIDGMNIYEYPSLASEEKKNILEEVVAALQELHDISSEPADLFSIWEAYVVKTYKRLDKVRDLIPFADREKICINGKECRNVFFYKKELNRMIDQYKSQKFCLIHGDCTFSNILLKNHADPVLIDPRGYFGFREIYGDAAYDWAKLYYSIQGNYDQFNRKRFLLKIENSEVGLEIQSNGWEDMAPLYWELLGDRVDPVYIKLFHAIIWLSLTTYAWEDYDSICGAFYNGLYYLEEVLQ